MNLSTLVRLPRTAIITRTKAWPVWLLLVIILVVARPHPSWAADETQNANWPEWRGPARDDISTETGLLKQWPEGGPPLLWTASGCGKGFSSVTIADGLIYTAGNFDDDTFVMAFYLNGKLKWKSLNGQRWIVPPGTSWAKGYDGARATPTVNDGLVYHLNALGRLAAFDVKTGEESWALDITQKFNSKVPLWGCSESVLIDRNNVICYPGGSKGYMVALNKKTGEVVWVNTDIGDAPANCSPILVEDHGIRQIITMTTVAVLGVNADTGKFEYRTVAQQTVCFQVKAAGVDAAQWHAVYGGVVGRVNHAAHRSRKALGSELHRLHVWEVGWEELSGRSPRELLCHAIAPFLVSRSDGMQKTPGNRSFSHHSIGNRFMLRRRPSGTAAERLRVCQDRMKTCRAG